MPLDHLTRKMMTSPWIQYAREATVAGYGIVLGLATYIFVNAIGHWWRKEDSFGGRMWATVCWVEMGMILACFMGFAARIEKIAEAGTPDIRFYLAPITLGVAITGQILALRLVRKARGGR
jgi:hypothetical protein